ncbi:Asx homology domain-containing protein [Xylariaceae sp. FL1272]|nr:Asx homology domain-containing protein [Xylariaceae sp. FL1272]
MPARKKSTASAASQPLRSSTRIRRQSALQKESEATASSGDELAKTDVPTTSHAEQVSDESTIVTQSTDRTISVGNPGHVSDGDTIIAHSTDRTISTGNHEIDEELLAVVNKMASTMPNNKRHSKEGSIPKPEDLKTTEPRRGTPIKKQEFEVVTIASGEEDELSAPSPKRAKPVPKTTQYGSFRKGRSKWDNPDEMLTNERAPLAFTNLRDLLCDPMTWEILSDQEKQKVLSQFPDDTEIEDAGTPDARPNIMALRNNNNFRHDVARYQEGLKDGQHDVEWIQQAQAAHSKRELGYYDDFLASDFQEKWDIPHPDQEKAEMAENGDDTVEVPEPRPNGDPNYPTQTEVDPLKIVNGGAEKTVIAEHQEGTTQKTGDAAPEDSVGEQTKNEGNHHEVLQNAPADVVEGISAQNNDGQPQPQPAGPDAEDAVMGDDPDKAVAQSTEQPLVQDEKTDTMTTAPPAHDAMQGIKVPSSQTEPASDQPPCETMQGIQGSGADHAAAQESHLQGKSGS